MPIKQRIHKNILLYGSTRLISKKYAFLEFLYENYADGTKIVLLNKCTKTNFIFANSKLYRRASNFFKLTSGKINKHSIQNSIIKI